MSKPRKPIDLEAVMKTMNVTNLPFKPPTAEEMSAALNELNKLPPMKRPPLRGQVAANRLKETEEMPATITPQAKVAPTTPVASKPHPFVASQPKYIVPNLKAFATPEAAYRADMALQATISKQSDWKNARAEVYCRSRGIDVLNTATTAVPAGGGYLVPDELSQAIITLKARAGQARKLAFIAPMQSGSLTVPWETDGLTVEYVGEAPSAAPTASDIDWGAINFNAQQRGVLGYISQVLEGDALIRFIDAYADRAAHALAKCEDREYILGDGTAAYGGEVGLIAALGSAGIYQPSNGVGLSV